MEETYDLYTYFSRDARSDEEVGGVPSDASFA